MMREFSLTNNSGATYNLSERKSFLFDVGGLGFTEATEFRSIGNHFSPLKRKFQQWVPQGTIFFDDYRTCYNEYHKFALFCQDVPLVLSYFQHSKWYNMQVLVASLDKKEIGERDGLECAIQFNAITPWYETIKASKTQVESDASKIYDYTYTDGFYIYGSENNPSITVYSDSYLKSPVKLTIHGPVLNPSWSLVCNGKLIGSGRVFRNVDAEQALVIDNTTADFSIRVVDASGLFSTDVYQQSDFTTDRFIYLEHGANVITVTQEGAEAISLEVEAHVEYETV